MGMIEDLGLLVLEENPFAAGQRLKIHWANDDSILEGNLYADEFENKGDLAFGWAGQMVQFYDAGLSALTHIFSKDDATIEILE